MGKDIRGGRALSLSVESQKGASLAKNESKFHIATFLPPPVLTQDLGTMFGLNTLCLFVRCFSVWVPACLLPCAFGVCVFSWLSLSVVAVFAPPTRFGINGWTMQAFKQLALRASTALPRQAVRSFSSAPDAAAPANNMAEFQIYRWSPETKAEPKLETYKIDMKETGPFVSFARVGARLL